MTTFEQLNIYCFFLTFLTTPYIPLLVLTFLTCMKILQNSEVVPCLFRRGFQRRNKQGPKLPRTREEQWMKQECSLLDLPCTFLLTQQQTLLKYHRLRRCHLLVQLAQDAYEQLLATSQNSSINQLFKRGICHAVPSVSRSIGRFVPVTTTFE